MYIYVCFHVIMYLVYDSIIIWFCCFKLSQGSLFTPTSHTQRQSVSSMWEHKTSKIVFFRNKGSADKVTVYNFCSLQPGEWLDNFIVNSYVRMTQEMATRCNSKVKLLNSHFFPKIENQVMREFIVSCFFFFNPFFCFNF